MCKSETWATSSHSSADHPFQKSEVKGGGGGVGGEGKTIQSKEDLRMGFNNMVQAG